MKTILSAPEGFVCQYLYERRAGFHYITHKGAKVTATQSRSDPRNWLFAEVLSIVSLEDSNLGCNIFKTGRNIMSFNFISQLLRRAKSCNDPIDYSLTQDCSEAVKRKFRKIQLQNFFLKTLFDQKLLSQDWWRVDRTNDQMPSGIYVQARTNPSIRYLRV